ncbi:MAG: cob(I)yrinic acid a,c-diamide adenosyltransferase [Chitinivibrionales bacterium]
MEKGYLQVYTGNGKGKTTAAIGLAVRAAGAGLRVWIGQFLKGQICSEHKSLERLGPEVTVEQFGHEDFVIGKPDQNTCRLAREGLKRAEEVISGGSYDVVILDEAAVAATLNLYDIKELIQLVDMRPEGMELVITGRNAPQKLIERADLVTEMKEIKHYYTRNVMSRNGIEQ